MKTNILLTALFCLLLIAPSGFAQEGSDIFIGTNGSITSESKAIYMQKCHIQQKNSTVQTFKLKDGKWEKFCSEQYKRIDDSTYQVKGNGENLPDNCTRTYKKQSEGLWMFKDLEKENLLRTGYTKSLIPLLLEGEVVEYYPNGNKKSKSVYKDNELVSNENWLENGDKYIDNVFYSVDSEPTFISGMTVLHQHIRTAFQEAGVDVSTTLGSMVVGFVVMENGTIDGIKVIKGLGAEINNVICNAFFTLALKGKWTPAKLNNKPVRYFQTFPINFKPDPNKENVAKVVHEIKVNSVQ
ncbi:MAG: energy transducer TonB [Candidatus Saccharibacteria bacterium]